jgi:hypothetical protein
LEIGTKTSLGAKILPITDFRKIRKESSRKLVRIVGPMQYLPNAQNEAHIFSLASQQARITSS